MAKPKDCSGCTKQATIHLTQIINNQIKKLDFCEDCPHQKGVTDPEGFSLAELLASGPLTGGTESPQQVVCAGCGMTPHDFKKSGRLGCGTCYDTFRDMLMPMLQSMHRGMSHTGKVPAGMLERVTLRRELEGLRAELETAVREERFEDAARHRDALRQLQSGPPGGKASGQNADLEDSPSSSGKS